MVHLTCALFYWAFSLTFFTEIYSMPSTSSLPVATTDSTALISFPKSRYERGLDNYDEALYRRERGLDEHYAEHYEEPKEQKKAVQGDPWGGYYEFLINEGSFKFWAVFQLVTAVILIYASLAAVYYAKFNVIAPDYVDDYDVLGRSNAQLPSSSLWSGLSAETFQRIFDALSSKKYS
ncbi:hypothetical protein WA026_004661 [Henosepilachna vigintioctopunctata]|uniref:Uncharacterized protein n=1 Tax=Henosepilachna vigintioctopunctata TaxID=420089 RepID=A0AAW1V9H5_9CUCU